MIVSYEPNDDLVYMQCLRDEIDILEARVCHDCWHSYLVLPTPNPLKGAIAEYERTWWRCYIMVGMSPGDFDGYYQSAI